MATKQSKSSDKRASGQSDHKVASTESKAAPSQAKASSKRSSQGGEKKSTRSASK